MSTVYLINTPSLPTPGSHHFTISKFVRGFQYVGLEKREVQSDMDLQGLPDRRGDLLIVSNHGLNERTVGLLSRFTEATVVGWFFHEHISYFGLPCKNFILTSEHFRQEPEQESHKWFWNFNKRVDYYEPLTFSLDLHPDSVGAWKWASEYKHDAVFIGFPYKDAWNRRLQHEGLNVFIHYSPPFMDEVERINRYTGSTVALGWHNDANLANHVVVERVFEGMGYGCVVVTDSWDAAALTDYQVSLIENVEDCARIVKDWCAYPKMATEQVERQYKWLRANGTYYHVAQRFLAKQKELGYA